MNQHLSRFFLGFALLWLAACQGNTPSTTPIAFGLPTPIPGGAATVETPILPTATLPPTATIGTQTAVPTPLPTPNATTATAATAATAVPWTIFVAADAPPEFHPAAANLAAHDGRFRAGDSAATSDVVITTLAGDAALAAWVYAVAAPFPTIPDGLSLEDLQAAWQTGQLTLTADVNATLRTLWGEPEQTAVIVPAAELVDSLWAAQTGYDDLHLTVLPFDQLEPRLKVLRLDGAAPITPDFDPATYGLTVAVSVTGDEAAVTAVRDLWDGPTGNRDPAFITTIAMTGPAGMRRAVADRMEKYGHTYPAEETGPVLQAVDIAHMSNENAFAPDCPPADPYDSDNVCNRDEYVDLMPWMGIDVVELTGNHLNDWGAWAMLHTLDLYDELGFHIFGGGRNLAEAQEPLLLQHNGNKIAFVGCNPVGPYLGWARADYPGAAPCDDYGLITGQIRQLADEGYTVIATLQYLEDYQYAVLPEQHAAFRALADAGAAAVSGSHAHHPQGFAFRPNGSFIHYGLGNLLSDQMWTLGARQTFIDTYVVYNGRLLSVDLWTGLTEDYARQRLMTAVERRDLLQAVFDASDW
ncbi:MAG: CapA family protein [Chloroflexi bacterium]|nr:CapA family protein [Chloroflexota bacterium]